jgi:ketosteroid isomerase-like protein
VSQESADTFSQAVEAFNRGGIEAALEHFDDEIEWWTPSDWLEDPVYRGHDGMRELVAYWNQAFDEFRLELVRTIDAGDQAVALAYQRGRMKGTADPIEQQLSYVAEAHGGKLRQVWVYLSWEEGLEAGKVNDPG